MASSPLHPLPPPARLLETYPALVFVNVFVVLARVIASHSRILSSLALHRKCCRVGSISFFPHKAAEEIQRLRYYLSRVLAGVLVTHPPIKDFLISIFISFFLLLLLRFPLPST